MTRVVLFFTVVAAISAAAVAGANTAFPNRIELPNGFQPEGIAVAGEQFYVGSIPTGAVYRGSLRTGQGSLLVPEQTDRAAIGMKADRGRLFVAGGPTGDAYVYNARTGETIAAYELPTSGATFVNDVVVTKRAAWFTDSQRAALYRLPLSANGRPGAAAAVQTVEFTGDYRHQAGSFNVNGIDATPNGKTLVIVQSGLGKLFTVTPAGVTKEIALAGAGVPNGDGILLDGKTLYVAQNRSNLIAKIALSPNLRSGRVVRRTGKPALDIDVPTTLAEHGSRLYAVNARFTTPPVPSTEYWVTKVPK